MKNIKKLLSILMVLTLVLALGANALAAEGTSKVTINPSLKDHTFTAYQIFTGTQAADQDNELASVKWGKDIDAAKFVAALKGIDGKRFADCKADDPQSVVKALSGAGTDLAEKVAEAAYDSLADGATGQAFSGETDLPNGYYLIKDTTVGLSGNDAYNDVVLQVTENVEIKNKTDVPEVEKKVQDNDSTAWQDSADWDIGDDVPFQITGTLPTNLDEYDVYKLVFHDVQSAGLTLNDDFVVTVGGVEATKGEDYTVVTSGLSDGCTFEIVFNDITEVEGAANSAKVVVTYTAELNTGAKIGYEGNPNQVTMEFSNNAHGSGTGTTPEDKVTVFTYQLTVNKQDGDGKELGNAAFTLFKEVEGAPEGANVLKSLKDDDGEPAELKVGDYYQPEEGGTIYQIVGTSTPAADKYTFDFKGLDDGNYLLVETTVPDGYNKADDIEFTITAEHDVESADPALNSFKATGDGISVDETKKDDTVVNGLITTNVKNMSGLELPETGGIGTTIFYVVGGILVVAAVILLVTRRRVSGSEK